jgi:hypothetical protein
MMTDSPTLPPALSDDDFHPDHPGPLGWLIYSLHHRLLALEGKAKPVVKAVETKAVETKAETVAEKAKEDVVETFHKVEAALGLSQN